MRLLNRILNRAYSILWCLWWLVVISIVEVVKGDLGMGEEA